MAVVAAPAAASPGDAWAPTSPLSVVVLAAVRSVSQQFTDVVESLELDDDNDHKRRQLLMLLTRSVQSCGRLLALIRWCTRRLQSYRLGRAAIALLDTYCLEWHRDFRLTSLTYPVWDLETALHCASSSGYYLLPRCTSGTDTLAAPPADRDRVRRRLRAMVSHHLHLHRPALPHHCTVSGTTISTSSYTLDLSLRMQPGRLHWALMALTFALVDDDGVEVVTPAQTHTIMEIERNRLMSCADLRLALQSLIASLDRDAVLIQFAVLERQARSFATSVTCTPTSISYPFWASATLRIVLTDTDLRVTLGSEPVRQWTASPKIAFSGILGAAQSQAAQRLLAGVPSSCRVDRRTGAVRFWSRSRPLTLADVSTMRQDNVLYWVGCARAILTAAGFDCVKHGWTESRGTIQCRRRGDATGSGATFVVECDADGRLRGPDGIDFRLDTRRGPHMLPVLRSLAHSPTLLS
ncbi:unnamed protein product (mitochondrion) [Plasmodiophora brassicae]|uniref:Mediator of RNA polymerase II transcription subunit 14 n=1 Tax=Plasmodiophora brassicae TaxID=37360 RepID=A0A0G4IHQ2_PLABS|nr:hypothetical protein PBRA_000390 [Plasmodiophora brassicae]SPQ96945.1 unnamed protein product [Plasmodiophora brassicae]